jgi:Ca-activated chloride channel family protein
MKVEIDEKILTQIAQITDGLHFRATNNKALKEIYDEIDLMEKTKMSVQEYSKKYEEYAFFAMIGLLLFLLELLLRYTLLKNIP